MKKYYVVEKEDEDWDLDSTPSYDTHDEAILRKREYEEEYGGEYVVWEVD